MIPVVLTTRALQKKDVSVCGSDQETHKSLRGTLHPKPHLVRRLSRGDTSDSSISTSGQHTHVPKLNLNQLALQGTAFVSRRAVNQVQSWALFPVEFPIHFSLVWIRKVMAERENGYHYNSPAPQG